MKLNMTTLSVVFASLATIGTAEAFSVPAPNRHGMLPGYGPVTDATCSSPFAGLHPGESMYKNNPSSHEDILSQGRDIIIGNDCRGHFFHIDHGGNLLRETTQVNVDFLDTYRAHRDSPVTQPSLSCVRDTSLDTDGDGLADRLEQNGLMDLDGVIFQTDPFNADTDGDGLSDGEEVGSPLDTQTARQRAAEYGLPFGGSAACHFDVVSVPVSPDSDQDFIEDGDEIDEGTNPRRADSDGDGLNDGGERLWGTDPISRDTDSDGLDDFFETRNSDYGYSALIPDARWGRSDFLSGVEKGADVVKSGVCGDFCDLNSLPELAGAIAVSVTPVVGTAADVRDYFANAIKGDQVSMFFSALGIIPFSGDIARSTQLTTHYVLQHPTQTSDVFRLVASATYMPDAPRHALFAATMEAGDKATHFSLFMKHGLDVATVERLAKGGTKLDDLAKVLNDCGGCIRRDVAMVGHQGWMPNFADAEKHLRLGHEKPKALPPPPREKTDVRFYDAIVGQVAMEAKTGYITNSKRVMRQIEKDCGMKVNQAANLSGLEWHFFASAGSNTIGAAPEVLRALKSCKNGAIPFVFHMP